ncbi:serine--tRNA ligase, mitochondrial isoform X2 [Ceratina calcarata]|uniref:serine--tRNA ligase n=1 Tax=Ceratina calcarata TaxID=156304 RepID=A0AAJ7RZC4_9HYME|nr:serine--tRNA ligase, mitochondrial isoform X1 [Ceratina calcarata]XP_026668500.1 serine--tRNA ligase, mitochondrial isoform X2 [Ceratina calcarata]
MWLPKQFVRQQFYRKTLLKKLSTQCDVNAIQHVPEPEYNIDFICNPANRDIIFNNIKLRKGMGDIDKVLEFSNKPELRDSLMHELNRIPNQTHPAVLAYDKEPQLLKEHGQKPEFDFKPQEFSKLVTGLQALRSQYLGPLIGQRGYMLVGDLADLEEALIHYTVKKLMKHGFKLVSVPDIIPTEVIERCGFLTDHGRTLVYNLDPFYGGYYSLSGTAEMSLAYKVMNTVFDASDLPLKMAAVSRCFRAEVSNLVEERGIYRVHQFTKVEMFICSKHEESEKQFQELQDIEEDLFSSLNLHFKVLDMPPHELGAPAYRKVDMEGWMPGRELYGELSSCSNCTDYQSRRLGIKYKAENGELLHVHTLNGTACAIPRMLIALCETYQTKHSRIRVPEVLIPYMKGKDLIKKQPVASSRPYKYKSD